MISISTTTASATGAVILDEIQGSILFDMPSRVSRTKTLDGGVYINHSGFSHGDRTVTVVAKVTEGKWDVLNQIYQNETIVLLSMPGGIYTAAIENLRREGVTVTIKIMLKEKEIS